MELKPSYKELEEEIIEQKKINNQLKENIEKYRKFAEDIDDLITQVDINGKILYVNSASLKYLGLSPEECIGQSAFGLVFPDDRDKTVDFFNSWLKTGKSSFSFENRLLHKNGRIFCMLWSINLIKDQEGNLKWINSIARDITADQKIRESLIRQETLLNEMGVLARVGGWELNLKTNEVYWTSQVYELHEVPEEFKPTLTGAKSFYVPESREILERSIAASIETGVPYDLELQIKTAKGNLLWVRTQGKVDYEDNIPVRLVGSFQDINERKQEQLELQNQKDLFSIIFDTAPYIMLIANKDGQVENINRAGLEFTGRKKEDVLGLMGGEVLNCLNSFNGLGCGRNIVCQECPIRTRIMNTFETGIPILNEEAELTVTASENQTIKLHFFISTLKFQRKDAMYVLATFVDITTRKLMEAELLEAKKEAENANRAKSAFLANMSHELRTPLNGIIGFSQLLEKQIENQLSEKHLGYFRTIRESGNHLLDMVNDILDLSKIEAGKIELNPTPFDLGKMLRRSTSIVRDLAYKKRIKLQTNIAEEVKWIVGDEVRLKQVFYNLLSNAIKFTEPGKQIGIKAVKSQASITITVWDEGIGIPAESLESIFDPFVQVTQNQISTIEGTGLGLSISKRLVEVHGGTLDATSEIDRGSRFIVTLPDKLVQKNIPLPANKEPEQPVDTNLDKQPIKILITEDNKANSDLIEAVLGNHVLDFVDTGEEAVEKSNTEKYDLILMDINLPGIDGSETMRRIRKTQNRKTPIIAVTSYAMKGDEEKYLNEGFNGYISKPIDIQNLIESIGSVINGSSSISKKTLKV